MKIYLIYAASWLGMVILAILNGAIREKVPEGVDMEQIIADSGL